MGPEVLEAGATALELSVLAGQFGATLGFVLMIGLALVPVVALAVLLALALIAAWRDCRRGSQRAGRDAGGGADKTNRPAVGLPSQ